MERVQELTFQVPLSFQLPRFYEQQSPERVALALRIGAQAVENLFLSIADQIREEQNSELVGQLEKKFLKKQEQYERERRTLEESLEHLRAKFSLDESLKTDMRHQLMAEAKHMYKEVLEEKDKTIHLLKDQLAGLKEQLTGEVRTLNDKISRQLGSQEKGKAGEVSMEDMIKKAYGMSPNFDLQSVGREAQKGDHIMEYKSIRAMWEIKNYTRMVSKEEVEKLHRDMRANPDVSLAIMVSLQSGIVGHSKAGDIDLEVLEDGRLVVYITNLFRRDDPILYIQSLRPILDITESRKDKKIMTSNEEIEALRFKVKVVHHILLKHQKTLSTLHNSVVQQKKKMDQMNSEFMALLREAESECKNSLQELLSNEDGASESALDTLNPELFTKTTMVELTKHQKTFVEWLRETCEEDPDGEIESKKFLEALKPTLKTERELKEVRELLQDSVWPKGGKKIKGLRLKA
jgi:hypothetical protein